MTNTATVTKQVSEEAINDLVYVAAMRLFSGVGEASDYRDICGDEVSAAHTWIDHNHPWIDDSENAKYIGWTFTFEELYEEPRVRRLYIERRKFDYVNNATKCKTWRHRVNAFCKMVQVREW